MRGAPCIGLIKARNEVEPFDGGYRGVIVIAGSGRWETPKASTPAAAKLLLDTLTDTLTPASTNRLFEACASEALGTLDIKRQLGHGLV